MPKFHFVGAAVSELTIDAANVTEARKVWREKTDRRLRFRRGPLTIQLLTDTPAVMDEDGKLHRQPKPSRICTKRENQG